MEKFISDELDQQHLEDLYQGDQEYAIEMFETFLTYTLEEYVKLRPLLEQNKVEAFQSLVHKLKPNFSFVGLTALEYKMLIIEQSCSQGSNQIELLKELSLIDKEVIRFKPIIENALQKMKQGV